MTKIAWTKLLQIWVLVGLISYLWLQIWVVLPQEQLRVGGKIALSILVLAIVHTLVLTPVIKYLPALTWRNALELVLRMQLLGQLYLTMPVVLLAPVLSWGLLLFGLVHPGTYALVRAALASLLVGGYLVGGVLIQLWVLRQYQAKTVTEQLIVGLVLANLVVLLGLLLVLKWVYAL